MKCCFGRNQRRGDGRGKLRVRAVLCGLLAVVVLMGGFMVFKPLPRGLDFTGTWYPLKDVSFLRDITYTDAQGVRRHDQQIMDEMLAMITQAETLLVLDQFLFNDFAGKEGAILRPLSHALTDAIVARKKANPALAVWCITDPLNTLYGGVVSPQQERLRASGVAVIETRLTALRDSNPLYSAWWRTLLRFWPMRWGPKLPNPLGLGRVPLQSYLRLLNFKANHRKTLVADRDGVLWGMVSSANPHDASSAHHNVAVKFRGRPVRDLVETERVVAAFSGGEVPGEPRREMVVIDGQKGGSIEGRILTERAVERAALELLDTAEAGDQIMLAMFYLSSRPIVRGLLRAHGRGVKVRVLLDPNKDAFGREKNGVPNRPVGAELDRAGIPVRWALTRGEQFHTKLLARLRADGQATVLLGSSNYTRRNLRNYNLETVIEVRGPIEDAFFEDVRAYLKRIWTNGNGAEISANFAVYDDASRWHRWLYRFQEATGLSTF